MNLPKPDSFSEKKHNIYCRIKSEGIHELAPFKQSFAAWANFQNADCEKCNSQQLYGHNLQGRGWEELV